MQLSNLVKISKLKEFENQTQVHCEKLDRSYNKAFGVLSCLRCVSD